MIFSLLVKVLWGNYCNFRSSYLKFNKYFFAKKIFKLILKGFEIENNCFLPFGITLEGPINFIHGPKNIFISGGAKIGINVTIYQNVTLGSNMLYGAKYFGSPSIGDNVLIGTGAAVIGKVKVGNNCRVGANAVVHNNVPDNSIVVSGSTIIQRQDAHMNNNIYTRAGNAWNYKQNGETVIEDNSDIINWLNDRITP